MQRYSSSGEEPLTVQELINQLTNLVKHGLSANSIVRAYDGDSGEIENVTGFLFDDNTLEICTDEN